MSQYKDNNVYTGTKPLYSGLFLTQNTSQELLDYVNAEIIAWKRMKAGSLSSDTKDWKIQCGHLTIKFKSNENDIELFNTPLIGNIITLKISHIVINSQMIIAKIDKNSIPEELNINNIHPHITLLHDKDIKPFFSNAILFKTFGGIEEQLNKIPENKRDFFLKSLDEVDVETVEVIDCDKEIMTTVGVCYNGAKMNHGGSKRKHKTKKRKSLCKRNNRYRKFRY